MSILRAVLPNTVKRHVWDLKYGVFGYPFYVAPVDVLAYFSSWLSDQTSILDLGCGRGSLLRALRESGWKGAYCGVDISKQAIGDAQKLADQNSTWAVSDFESFRSPAKWDIITMVESIYYVPLDGLPEFLSGLMTMLSDKGRILFRLHDLEKYREYTDLIYKLYPTAEKVAENVFYITIAGSIAA
jgi:cyclopropane fatty-acyl-phospholipid synthase-like methyltransferase